jgi:hypothetical protein
MEATVPRGFEACLETPLVADAELRTEGRRAPTTSLFDCAAGLDGSGVGPTARADKAREGEECCNREPARTQGCARSEHGALGSMG